MKSLIKVFALAAALLSSASLFAKEAAPVRLHVDVDRTVLPAGTKETAIVRIGLDCIPVPRHGNRPPINLALVIDRSGSMSGDKIERAREAALGLVRQLGDNDIVSLVAYDTDVETLVKAQRVREARRELESAIRGLEASGNTALHGGVSKGAAEIRRHLGESRHVPRIILLSDGQANVGPSSPEELGRLGASLMKEGISVSTIGLGLGFNEDLMTRLADRSDGNTYFVQESDDLPRIFAAELGDVLNVVARRVVVEIEFPAGVRPLRFVGREGVMHGQKAELSLNQLYGGQEKFALIEVEVSPTKPGENREIARARLSYENASSQRNATAEAARNITFSADDAEVVKSANHKLQADYAANVLAKAKDEAIAHADAGRRDEAARVLRDNAASLSVIGRRYSNYSVQETAAAAAPAAAKIEADGISNAERKAMRAEAQQVKAQQSNK
jgi:Ca-activated chloride channel homolog